MILFYVFDFIFLKYFQFNSMLLRSTLIAIFIWSTASNCCVIAQDVSMSPPPRLLQSHVITFFRYIYIYLHLSTSLSIYLSRSKMQGMHIPNFTKSCHIALSSGCATHSHQQRLNAPPDPQSLLKDTQLDSKQVR